MYSSLKCSTHFDLYAFSSRANRFALFSKNSSDSCYAETHAVAIIDLFRIRPKVARQRTYVTSPVYIQPEIVLPKLMAAQSHRSSRVTRY